MNKTVIFQIVLIIFSFALIILGIKLGNVDMVMEKAINICLECIGIG